MQKDLVYNSFILLCKIINSVKIKVKHFIFFSVMIITESYLLGKCLPAVIKQIILQISIFVQL